MWSVKFICFGTICFLVFLINVVICEWLLDLGVKFVFQVFSYLNLFQFCALIWIWHKD